jgi:hypothetical protein
MFVSWLFKGFKRSFGMESSNFQLGMAASGDGGGWPHR